MMEMAQSPRAEVLILKAAVLGGGPFSGSISWRLCFLNWIIIRKQMSTAVEESLLWRGLSSLQLSHSLGYVFAWCLQSCYDTGRWSSENAGFWASRTVRQLELFASWINLSTTPYNNSANSLRRVCGSEIKYLLIAAILSIWCNLCNQYQKEWLIWDYSGFSFSLCFLDVLYYFAWKCPKTYCLRAAFFSKFKLASSLELFILDCFSGLL